MMSGTVDSSGRLVVALVSCDDDCQQADSHLKKNKVHTTFINAFDNSFAPWEYEMREVEVEQLELKRDMLIVAQPQHYLLDPFTGVADLIGKITIFHITRNANPFTELYIFTGDDENQTALSVGESLEVRLRYIYDTTVYEVFYHNWMYIDNFQDQR